MILSHPRGAYTFGDIVAYGVPRGQPGAGLVVIHRIVGGSPTAGFVTKGDNNPVSDPWHPRQSDIVGSPWVHVPRIGRLLVLLHRPAVAAALAAAIAALAVLRRPAGRAATSIDEARPAAAM